VAQWPATTEDGPFCRTHQGVCRKGSLQGTWALASPSRQPEARCAPHCISAKHDGRPPCGHISSTRGIPARSCKSGLPMRRSAAHRALPVPLVFTSQWAFTPPPRRAIAVSFVYRLPAQRAA
jgi:hypothetical protein